MKNSSKQSIIEIWGHHESSIKNNLNKIKDGKTIQSNSLALLYSQKGQKQIVQQFLESTAMVNTRVHLINNHIIESIILKVIQNIVKMANKIRQEWKVDWQFKGMNKMQINKLTFRLKYYHKWLPEKQANSFRAILKNMYKISDESLKNIDIIYLYNCFEKEVKKMKSEDQKIAQQEYIKYQLTPQKQCIPKKIKRKTKPKFNVSHLKSVSHLYLASKSVHKVSEYLMSKFPVLNWSVPVVQEIIAYIVKVQLERQITRYSSMKQVQKVICDEKMLNKYINEELSQTMKQLLLSFYIQGRACLPQKIMNEIIQKVQVRLDKKQ